MKQRLRILWVTPSIPRRGESAACERFWALLSRLARRHEVTLIAQCGPEEEALPDDVLPPGLADVERVPRPACRASDPFHLLPLTVRWGAISPALGAAVARRVASGAVDVVQWEYVEMGHAMPPPAVPTVLTVHQLGFAAALPEWRAAGARPRAMPRAIFRHLRDLDFELRATLLAHVVVTVSADDARRLQRFVPGLRVAVSPCGVDPAHFASDAVAPASPTDLLFVGNFGHPPNRDAVAFLARDVLPRLGRASLRIAGRCVTPEVAALATVPGVEVVGEVDDVRPHLRAARVVVAPVRFGTGMRGKVLEALAMERPVVATPLGAEGLDALHGKHLLVARAAGDWARTIGALLADPALARRLGRDGRELVARRFGWDEIAAAHDAIYQRAIEAARPCAAAFARRALPWAALIGSLPRSQRPRARRVAGALIAARRGAHWYARAARWR